MSKKSYFLYNIIIIAAAIALSSYFFITKKMSFLYATLIIFGIIIVLLAFTYFVTKRQTEKIKYLEGKLDAWNNTSVHLKKAGDEAFNELPVGIILYDEYTVTWANKFAKDIFKSKLVEKTLNSLVENFTSLIEEHSEVFTITFKNNKYDVISKKDNKLLYLFDVTKRENLNLKYQQKMLSIGIIGFDNLENSLKNSNKSVKEETLIRGQILGRITDWAEENGTYIKMLDDDRIILITDYEHLSNMIIDKFSILNDIRTISKDNDIQASISMGIACHDLVSDKLGDLASKAIDMAEKRGGDQVVVNIVGNPIMYFGATLQNSESSTLVSVRREANLLREFILKYSKLFIMAHTMSDTDALGAMIAALQIGLATSKPSYILYDYEKLDSTTKKIFQEIKEKNLDIYSKFIEISNYESFYDDDCALLVVDTQTPGLIMNKDVLKRFKHIGVIDHHRRGEIFFDNAEYIYTETSASSTVELITEIFQFYKNKVTLSPYESTILLSGIVVDTNNFTYRTTERTFDVIKELKKRGADMVLVRALLRDNIEDQIEIAKNVSNVKIIFGNIAVVKCLEDTIYYDRTTLAKISEKTLDIESIKASFTIAYVDESVVGISARSYYEINVQVILEELGGGGHINSAACQIKNTTIEAAYQKLYEILQREFDEDGDEKMKVILLEDVKGRGLKNQVIEVANGYGNFLLTNNKAVIASDENLKAIEKQKEQEKIDAENHRKVLLKVKSEIEAKSVNLFIKLGNDGKAFGMITTKQISEEFEAQTGILLDKRKIVLPSQITSIGIYSAKVILDKGIEANIKLNVLEK